MWKDLVNTGVLEIMSYLPYYDIVRAGQVCRRWHTLSLDDLLWKAVLTRHLNIPPPVTLRPGAQSWRKEFIRIIDDVPSEVTDLPEHHIQEDTTDYRTHPGWPPKATLATHVTFAHSKEMFSVCYGWKGVAVWRSSHPCTRISVMHNLGWKATSSKFNEPATLLLVTGETETDREDTMHGKLAIYQSGGAVFPDQFSLVQVIDRWCNPPYNGWITDSTFLITNTTFLTDDGDGKKIQVFLESADPFNDTREMLYDVNHDNIVPYKSNCSMRDAEGGTGTPSMVVLMGKQEFYLRQDPQDIEGNYYHMDRPWDMAPTRIGILDKHNTNEFKIFNPTDEDFEHMLIEGLCPSPDQKICYISARPLTKNLEYVNPQYFPLAFISNEKLQILPLDLSTMTVGPPLTGHKGIAHDNIDWTRSNDLFPDVTSYYVGCGSDFGRAYLWDRHYGCLVSELSGSLTKNVPTPQEEDQTNDRKGDADEEFTMAKDEHEGEEVELTDEEEKAEDEKDTEDKEAIVSVAVDPSRQNVMVTVGKNGRIKVFRSKKWIRENGFRQ